MTRLTHNQNVPLTDDERADLRRAAAAHDVRPGIFARALLLYALARHGRDPALEDAIATEKDASSARASTAASAAAAKRWRK